MSTSTSEEERFLNEPYRPCYLPFTRKPIHVRQRHDYDQAVFVQRPFFGVLVFDNNTSDARDHCANERTFLSWLRLAVYMAIVSVAIMISFHLKRRPSDIERRLALPFGVVFWCLSLACLAAGVANYITTVSRYSRRAALVQSGWKTEVVFTIVATAIVAACVLFLSVRADSRTRDLSSSILSFYVA